ncbi:kinase-like domain-containing protein [Trichoderma ceciliae]
MPIRRTLRGAGGLGKREATDDLGRDGLAKRRKGAGGRIVNPRNTVDKDTALFLNLNETARVQISPRVITDTSYGIQITRRISNNFKSQIYACMHSRFEGQLALKEFCYTPGDISQVATTWKQQKTLLQQMDHENIIKLMAFDGRIFTLYMELLPSTLDKRAHFSPRDALKVLQNISSALEYLELHNIIHRDVKPENIAYSRSRGAVLLDFELSNNKDIMTSGTPWYMPPEVSKRGVCGHAGDIWALGVTMLYVTGVIPLPDQNAVGWNMVSAFRRGSKDHKNMRDWFKGIAATRTQLAERKLKEPQVSEIYSLIFQMLHPEAEKRVRAAELHAAANKLTISEWIQRCKSPVS